MSKLQVEVDDFAMAARTMHHEVGESVRTTLQGLVGTLEANTDLVGQDSAGLSWAAGYDPAARSVLEATAQIVDAAFGTSQLFAQSGANYAVAEEASTTHGRPSDHRGLTELTRPQSRTVAPRLPSSAGAGNGTPAGWWLIEHTVGYVWPGGHQDRLRATAEGWRRAAGGIESVAFKPVSISAVFACDRVPEADDVSTVCAGFHNRLDDLARGYRALGRACDEYAEHLDECHEAVRSELTELMVESAGIQVVGALASIFTFGAAEVPTQATQAGLAAAAAARIGGLIAKVVVAARRLAAGVHGVMETAKEAVRALDGLANARIAYAGVASVPAVARGGRVLAAGRSAGRSLRMSREGKEIAASAGRIAEDAASVARRAEKQAARTALPEGALRAAGNRFFRDATAKSRDYKISPTADGGYQLQFFSPANNAGYGKLYVQVIDRGGQVVSEYKDTLGPAGLIERKVLRGK